MAAGSDLLDEVFLNAEVDEKVVSDLVGSLESQLAASGHHRQHHKAQEPLRAAGALLGNHVGSSGGGGSSSSSPSPSPGGGGGGGGAGGNANVQTESPGGGTTTTGNPPAKMGLAGPEITKPGAGPCKGVLSIITPGPRAPVWTGPPPPASVLLPESKADLRLLLPQGPSARANQWSSAPWQQLCRRGMGKLGPRPCRL
ncbi:transcription initiation factor TFIID subunit 4-like [Sphaerodactylus townsendi]|uniref:transcription initiation factor TFIID subunit 4-like n=1 Tax=Sphaerodactylus townsendi TaxID=933632 RepID=UPI0020268228|nr:transcription initiation factor TFIID subunit 4-like [Sphaerodactylus townsendi]